MTVNYKKELESAAKSMILVHDPEVLTKMIVRTIIQKVMVSHAGVLLRDKSKNSYILTVSRGPKGTKIPAGFTRMDADNPLIRFFLERRNKLVSNDGSLSYEEGKKLLKQNLDPNLSQLLNQALYQMEIFDAMLCVPSFFRKELLGMLLLGKKRDEKKFTTEEVDFFNALASDVAMAIRNAQLFTDLELELDRKYRLFTHTTIALAAAIDAKDHYTHGHTARVTNISLDIARKIASKSAHLDHNFLENLHISSLLHDIGKIGVPESILNKNGPLTESEKDLIKKHPVIGVTILQPIRELCDAIPGVKYHHEKYDGSGYPDGLIGASIPLIASIISVADTFDAMTTDRPYRKGLSKDEAAKEIIKQRGRQFSPDIVDAFIELFEEGKI